MWTIQPRLAGAIILALGAASVARAQTRPLLTEEATTAPAGALVVEAGADAIRREPNFLTWLERDRFDLPVLRLVFSPADTVELDVEWVGRIIARDDPTFGTVADFGDVSLRAKLRLRDRQGGSPALGARFGMTLPETSFGTGLGPNTMRMSAQMLLSQPLGPATLHLNAGLAIQDEALRAHEQRDFLAYGMALEAPLSRALTAMAELAGVAGRGKPGTDAHAEARAGLRVGAGRVRADAAVRRGLAKADGTWGMTAGLTWRVRAGR